MHLKMLFLFSKAFIALLSQTQGRVTRVSSSLHEIRKTFAILELIKNEPEFSARLENIFFSHNLIT